MITIAMTGASGTMGQEAVPALMKNPDVRLRLLMRQTKRGSRYASRYRKVYGDRVEIFFGDIRVMDDCMKLCRDTDYLLHLAAVIPPLSDHEEEMTMTTNRDGTGNLIQAVINTGNRAKFIHISTVAVYGDRNEKHPWGRVGDPLITSAFDVYGLSKTMAEYSVLESDLDSWVILRQTGVLYDELLMNNINDGLMFHTPWNVPIEWVTAHDSAILLAGIIRHDQAGKINDFWKQVYNIGGGEHTRVTGFETSEAGFALIGSSVRKIFRPHWNATRNFHCFWFSDSDVLEDMFHYRRQSCEDFWSQYARSHRIFSLGRFSPAALIRRFVIERLFNNTNAPMYWVRHRDAARVQAFYGGVKAYNSIPRNWDDTYLLCEDPSYEQLKIYDSKWDLDHGYDESKPDSELNIEDMKAAAAFRGGKCLSESMTPGDLYTRLTWCCHEGHIFEATPFTILKAGHWCPECCQTDNRWNADRIAAHSPFHAQVWLDSHSADERYIYILEDGQARMETFTE